MVELLFKKTPKEAEITKEDKKIYKDIVLNAHAHKKNFKADCSIRSDSTGKLQIFVLNNSSGHGYMITNSNPVEYVHWDDPNELVDRLRLLEAAGNNNHNNEIMPIIEELREAEIIY